MKLDNLTKEQFEKVSACDTTEEKLKYLNENKIELAPEQMEVVSGGGVFGPVWTTCMECYYKTGVMDQGQKTGKQRPNTKGGAFPEWELVCPTCGKVWWSE